MLRILPLLLLLAGGAHAQPFVVESATPADGSGDVPTQTTVSFTFSEPVAEAPTLVAFPIGETDLGEPTLSDDGRTASYAATLQPNTRHIVLVLDATSADGDRLARPFALNLATGSNGFLTFRGEVTDSEGASVEGSIVALVTGNPLTGDVQFVAMDVIEGSGSAETYAVGPAPLGLYVVGAVRLTAADLTAFAYGFFDPDGNGVPDLITSPSGNDVTLAPPAPSTAGGDFESAQGSAEDALPGAELVGISRQTVDDEGRARVWIYAFEEETERVEVLQIGLFSLPVPREGGGTGSEPLPVPFLDSDRALDRADAMGGEAFTTEEEAMGRTVSVVMGAGATITRGGGDGGAEWEVTYSSREAPGADPVASLTIPVPMMAPTSGEPAPVGALAIRAMENPTRGALRLAVSLAESEDAEVALFDVRGRRVATLHRGRLAAGETVLSTARDLPAGLYLARVATPTARRTVRVSVVR